MLWRVGAGCERPRLLASRLTFLYILNSEMEVKGGEVVFRYIISSESDR